MRPQIWRVVQVGDGVRRKPESAARVSHVLQVSGTGELGLAQIASAQRAMVHLRQLRGVGISRGSYEHRVKAGALHRVFPSVLSVVHPVLEPWAMETAALLYVGDDAVLSHETAAAVWRLAPRPSFVAITLINRKARAQSGLRLHEVDALDIRDVTVHDGFPVTSPARTLIDCAARGDIENLLNEARVQRLVTDKAITAAMDRCPGRKGIRSLRSLLAGEYERGYSRSEAERRLRRLIQEAGLSPPTFNGRVLGFEVDAVWRAQMLVVEVDGYRTHGHRSAFERDRAKDQALIGGGYTVLRLTWNQLTQRPLLVVARIAAELAKRS